MLLRHKPKEILAQIPITDVWRFFIDGVLQNGEERKDREDLLPIQRRAGWPQFENERGYLKGMCNAFAFSLKNPDALSVDFIKDLHSYATNNVDLKLYKQESKESNKGNFRSDDQDELSCGLGRSNTTEEGIFELLKTIRDDANYIYIGNFDLSSMFCHENLQNKDDTQLKEHAKQIFSRTKEHRAEYAVYMSPLSAGKIEELVADCITEYQQEIKKAKNNEEIIRTIAIFIHGIELIHPFVDANTRTFSMLLLNHLLLQNGLLPAMLFYPNLCCYGDIDSIVWEIERGIEDTQEIINGETPHPRSISTLELLNQLTPEEFRYYMEAVSPLRPFLNIPLKLKV